MAPFRRVAVIGAGMVGVSAALWLQRAGCEVTLIDRDGPASGASQGNAGVLASGAVVPVTVPGLLPKAPGLLFSADEPLFLRWSYVPRMLPFLARYLAQARADRVERISTALHLLAHDAPDQHAALAQGTGAEEYITPGSYLFGYESREAFEKDAYGWGVRRRRGVPFRTLEPEELAAHDPALKGRFGYGVDCPQHGVVADPGGYVRRLARHFQDAGGRYVRGTLTGFREAGQKAAAAQMQDGTEVTADGFVMTLGAWSGGIARDLGVRVPLESERGYHIEFHDPNIMLRHPIMVAASKFVVTPMRDRLRCAGIVEFGGLEAGPSTAPLALLKRQMARLFPDLTSAHQTEWMGHRPATADSLPVIGPSPRLPNVYLGYGHHHIGLTCGPRTGRLLAQMMTGDRPNIDVSAFAADRRL